MTRRKRQASDDHEEAARAPTAPAPADTERDPKPVGFTVIRSRRDQERIDAAAAADAD